MMKLISAVSLPEGSMYLYSIYLGLKGVPVLSLKGRSIVCTIYRHMDP